MDFRPLDDRVLIEPLEAEEKTAGGIILPDAAKDKPTQGRVVAVGPGVRNGDGSHAPMQVAAGDIVVFGKYGGTDVTLGDVDYKVIRESDILAKVE